MSFSIFQTGSGYNCYWWIYKLDLNHLQVDLLKRMAPYIGETGNENEASNTVVILSRSNIKPQCLGPVSI